MIKTPSSTVIGGAGIWTPGCAVIGAPNNIHQFIKSLFSDGSQGAYLDNNDLSTVYQDAAGTTPVTAVGQSLGLELDKSKGLVLGSELVTNGDFSNGTTGWTAASPTYVRLNGVVEGKAELEVVANASGNTGIERSIPTVVGKFYIATVDVTSHASNSGFIWNATSSLQGSSVFGSGKSQLIFQATSTATLIRCAVSLNNEVVGQKYYFDNVTVRELAGLHAYQTTSIKRPILTQGAKSKYAKFDAVDDVLQFNNAALSNATIIRVSSSGVTVLKNQSIAANHTITQDFSHYLMINKALSDSEIARITAEFSKYV
jgi:hypothetical protein